MGGRSVESMDEPHAPILDALRSIPAIDRTTDYGPHIFAPNPRVTCEVDPYEGARCSVEAFGYGMGGREPQVVARRLLREVYWLWKDDMPTEWDAAVRVAFVALGGELTTLLTPNPPDPETDRERADRLEHERDELQRQINALLWGPEGDGVGSLRAERDDALAKLAALQAAARTYREAVRAVSIRKERYLADDWDDGPDGEAVSVAEHLAGEALVALLPEAKP